MKILYLTLCAAILSSCIPIQKQQPKPKITKPKMTKYKVKELFDSFFPREIAETQVTPQGVKIIIKNKILFDFDSYRLKPQAKELLKRLADIYLQKILPNYPHSKIVIIGYTDDIGSKKYNLKLSYKRAESAAKFLESLGISKNHIKYLGKGEENPIVPNTNPENRAKNRRVEISIDLSDKDERNSNKKVN
jgi:outer membrane protein OmpA-like peptidoglycan-associated protein